jgi:hypothetical protein
MAQAKPETKEVKPAKPATPAAAPATPAAPATDKKADAADKKADPMEAAWAKAAEVNKNHEWMKFFEGEWSTSVKEFDPMTGKEAGSGSGTMTCKVVLGGRFLSMDFDGRFQGKFFRGMGTLGYSNVNSRYEGTWMDSMSTHTSMSTGSVDASGKVMTMLSEPTDPMSGKPVKQREVTTITGKDAYKMEMFMTFGGKEAKLMEISYTKGKAGKEEKAVKDDKAVKEDKAAKEEKPEKKDKK